MEEWDLSLVGDGNEFTKNGAPEQRTHGPTHEFLTLGTGAFTHGSNGGTSPRTRRANADQADDVQYVYDALSRRIARTEWDGADPPEPDQRH